jgi:hypothetical protein
MSEPKHESESGLIIDPAVLADIRAQCQRRRAELEAAGSLPVPTIAPESPQSAPAALSAPSPIPLASAFWQSLLFGNPDSLVSSSDATRALQLVSDKLGFPIADGETIDTERAGQLRKLLRGRFGLAAEQTMSALWRSAPASPGAPQPDIGQSQLPAGPLPTGRNEPRWIEGLNEPGGSERAWLNENGLWCG